MLTRVKLHNYDLGHENDHLIKKKSWNSILNQFNIKWWNLKKINFKKKYLKWKKIEIKRIKIKLKKNKNKMTGQF
jgi:hypothetical protein